MLALEASERPDALAWGRHAAGERRAEEELTLFSRVTMNAVLIFRLALRVEGTVR